MPEDIFPWPHLTPAQFDELKRRYPTESNEKLSEEFGIDWWPFRTGITKLGWLKDKAYRSAVSRKAAQTMQKNRQDDNRKIQGGIRRKIATGTVIIKGNVLTHISST